MVGSGGETSGLSKAVGGDWRALAGWTAVADTTPVFRAACRVQRRPTIELRTAFWFRSLKIAPLVSLRESGAALGSQGRRRRCTWPTILRSTARLLQMYPHSPPPFVSSHLPKRPTAAGKPWIFLTSMRNPFAISRQGYPINCSV